MFYSLDFWTVSKIIDPSLHNEFILNDIYFFNVLAVRSGDVVKFDVVRSKYVDQFKSDRTFTLILRLHHNVIKTAIRRISLAYSRISLGKISLKMSKVTIFSLKHKFHFKI